MTDKPMTDAPKYHAIPARIIVKPVGADIFDETATVVEVEDESAGPFVKVSQPGDEREDASIAIEGPEWPLIRDAIQKMMNVVQGLDTDVLKR